MTDKKPIVIDLCKIGWGAWIAVSIFLVFCQVSEESANLTWTENEERGKGDFVPDNSGIGEHWDKNATRLYMMECYQGILDSGKQCQTNNDDMHGTFIFFSYIFGFVNALNAFLLFVVLNRKYGKYEFKFKTCGGKNL